MTGTRRPKSYGRHQLPLCPACGKFWYSSYAKAMKMAAKVLRERDTMLFIYICPVDEQLYHLTKEEFHRDRGEVL